MAESESRFSLHLELEQLKAKVRLLAGGIEGEQLAEILVEREVGNRMPSMRDPHEGCL